MVTLRMAYLRSVPLVRNLGKSSTTQTRSLPSLIALQNPVSLRRRSEVQVIFFARLLL